MHTLTLLKAHTKGPWPHLFAILPPAILTSSLVDYQRLVGIVTLPNLMHSWNSCKSSSCSRTLNREELFDFDVD